MLHCPHSTEGLTVGRGMFYKLVDSYTLVVGFVSAVFEYI